MVGYGDLWQSLGSISVAIAAVAAIVGLVVWRGRRRGSTTIALDAALTISGWWVALSAIGIAAIVAKAWTADWAEISVSGFQLPWPEQVPCSEFGDSNAPMLTCSSTQPKFATVASASLGLRLLAALAQLTPHILGALPAAMLAVICFQTLRGRTFSFTVTRTLTVGAVFVLVLGIASELLAGITATVGLREVFPPDSEWYPSGFQLIVTPLPFAGALALVALAAVFRQGIRLQMEKDRLQRETEGLV